MSTSNPTTGAIPKRRDRSFRDVLMLADDFFMKKGIALNLPLELRDKLDVSVRPEYQRIWEAANKDPQR